MNSPLTRRHISAKYDEELEQIRYQLLSLGGLVEQELRNAIVSIRGNDFTQAVHVSNILRDIEPIRSCIEDACENFIMLHQPSGKDLRLILAIVKMTGDLKVLVHLIKKVIRPVLEHQCVEWSPLEDLYASTEVHLAFNIPR